MHGLGSSNTSGESRLSSTCLSPSLRHLLHSRSAHVIELPQSFALLLNTSIVINPSYRSTSHIVASLLRSRIRERIIHRVFQLLIASLRVRTLRVRTVALQAPQSFTLSHQARPFYGQWPPATSHRSATLIWGQLRMTHTVRDTNPRNALGADLTFIAGEELINKRRLGQTELAVDPGQVGTSNATKPKNLGTFDYAHLRVPLPKDLKGSGIFHASRNHSTPEAYFLMV